MYKRVNIIDRQHGWGDAAPIGQSIGTIAGSLLSMFGPKPATPVVAPTTDNTGLYLGVAAVAGIGIFFWSRRKKR